MPEIGETLREARMRRRIDMAEVESATKIRAKYLRALENEEWDLLPGPTFVKTFLRTYAEYLELDARLLVEEYKQRFERPAGMDAHAAEPAPPAAPAARGAADRARASWSCSASSALLGALYAARASRATTTTSSEPPARGRDAPRRRRRSAADEGAKKQAARRAGRCACSIVATGQVYVCLEDARGRAVVDKETLEAGQRTRTFRGRRFQVTFGTAAARMRAERASSYRVADEPGPGRLRAAPGPPPAADHERPGRLHVSARAGIVVTGTEVLSGIIADRNGPWLAERLRERGVELAHVMIVGDRPRGPARGAGLPRRARAWT